MLNFPIGFWVLTGYFFWINQSALRKPIGKLSQVGIGENDFLGSECQHSEAIGTQIINLQWFIIIHCELVRNPGFRVHWKQVNWSACLKSTTADKKDLCCDYSLNICAKSKW